MRKSDSEDDASVLLMPAAMVSTSSPADSVVPCGLSLIHWKMCYIFRTVAREARDDLACVCETVRCRRTVAQHAPLHVDWLVSHEEVDESDSYRCGSAINAQKR